MKMNTNKIPAVLASFIDEQVAPQASAMQKFGAYSMLYVINNRLPDIVAQYTPIMKMTGVMDDTGMIDLEYLHEMSSDAMAHAGKLNVWGYLMDSADIEKLYQIAKRQA